MPSMRAEHTTSIFGLNPGLPSALIAIAALGLAACEPGMLDPNDDDPDARSIDAPLSDLDALLGDAPDNATLPELGKADAVYPEVFDLMDLQTPARNQGSRGTCAIFATTGLMEHLYLIAGWPGEPNFSEQYLQWSTKVQQGVHRNSDGSSATSNISAIAFYGIVEEEHWPYETRAWGVSDDPECTGDNRPTRCYTNGEPPAEAVEARKWRLPPGKWVSRTSVKAHMTQHNTAVTASMKFFYQSWNHGMSSLPTNSHYLRQGYVTYPNEADKLDSEEKPAGHAVLLVGWDDTLEVPKRDENGDLVLDADGNPEVERGFFLFKNSWGTSRFGLENPYGRPGFGYISMRYIEEYASIYTSNVPRYTPPVEICDDGIDNTGNGLVDCDDPACANDEACANDDPAKSQHYFENDEGVAIPDDDSTGIVSEIFIEEGGAIQALTVAVGITHTWRGDLRVKLVKDGTEVTLHDRTGSSEKDLEDMWTVTEFNDAEMRGLWTLHVSDMAPQDTGTLDYWWLEITTSD